MSKKLDLDFETLIENCLHSVLEDSTKYKKILKKKIIETYINDKEEIKSLKKGELFFPSKQISLKWQKGYGYRGQPDEVLNLYRIWGDIYKSDKLNMIRKNNGLIVIAITRQFNYSNIVIFADKIYSKEEVDKIFAFLSI